MSTTLATVRDHVRTLLRDRNAGAAMVNTFELNRMIGDEAMRVASEIGLGPTWETGAIPIVVGIYEYVLSVPTSKTYMTQLLNVRLASRNWPIQRITDEMLEGFRMGPSVSNGFPQYVSIREKDDQTLLFRFWPIPNQTDSVDLLRSWMPTLTADTDTIPLSDFAISLLVKRVVRNALAMLSDDVTTNRQINRAYAQSLDKDIEEGTRLERIRINSLKRTGMIARGQV